MRILILIRRRGIGPLISFRVTELAVNVLTGIELVYVLLNLRSQLMFLDLEIVLFLREKVNRFAFAHLLLSFAERDVQGLRSSADSSALSGQSAFSWNAIFCCLKKLIFKFYYMYRKDNY